MVERIGADICCGITGSKTKEEKIAVEFVQNTSSFNQTAYIYSNRNLDGKVLYLENGQNYYRMIYWLLYRNDQL